MGNKRKCKKDRQKRQRHRIFFSFTYPNIVNGHVSDAYDPSLVYTIPH